MRSSQRQRCSWSMSGACRMPPQGERAVCTPCMRRVVCTPRAQAGHSPACSWEGQQLAWLRI